MIKATFDAEKAMEFSTLQFSGLLRNAMEINNHTAKEVASRTNSLLGCVEQWLDGGSEPVTGREHVIGYINDAFTRLYTEDEAAYRIRMAQELRRTKIYCLSYEEE